MKVYIPFLMLLAVAASYRVSAQSETTDLTKQTEPNDKSRQAMFNLQNPSAALTAGGSFYVSNPVPAYEIDTEKAYLDPEFSPLSVTLKSGKEYEMPGRIRLIDQRVEVRVEGEVYELDTPAIESVADGQGRVFIPGFDPVGRTRGVQWYEVAFSGARYRMLVGESTVWEDPPQKNMFDTSEPRKTLKRVTRQYLIAENGNTEIDKMKDLLKGVGKPDQEPATRYARQKRLKNQREDYLNLLQYLETLHPR